MQTEYVRKCSLCLVKEAEVAPFLQELKVRHPEVEMALFPMPGALQVMFQSETPVDALVEALQKRFSTFFLGEGRIAENLHRECIKRKKLVAFAESCTGGRLAAEITAMPGASAYFLGSIVAYSNAWKERFLQMSRTTLKEKGEISKEAVIEMAQGLLQETDADLVAAVSGVAGPSGGTKEKPVGTLYIAIGARGQKIDAGVVHASAQREETMALAVQLILGALWRRLVHNTATFS